MVKDVAAEDGMIDAALSILADTNLKARLEEQIKGLAKPNAAETIAREVLEMMAW